MATPIPSNRAVFSLQELLVATQGVLLQGTLESVIGVSTDTRSIQPGNLFVALVGATHDGHDHIGAAIARGATALLISRSIEVPDGIATILVRDTLLALGALGRAHRRRWSAMGRSGRRVIGITGSAGKTTTRSAASAALRAAGFRVHASQGNLNNAIGIPMVLLGLSDEHDVAVMEVGTSSRGEIAYNCTLIEQDISVLTLIAAAHTEKIGTIDDVGYEKGEIFSSLRWEGVAIGNADNAHVRAQLLRSPARRWFTYGESLGADLRIVKRCSDGLERSQISLCFSPRACDELSVFETIELDTPLLGMAGAYATAAAILLAAVMKPGLNAEVVSAEFSAIVGEEGRLQVQRLVDGTVLLDDSYNANRASVLSSLGTAAEIAKQEGRRLVAVLGEMRELGALSKQEHRLVGDAAARLGATVIAVQGEAAEIARAASEGGANACFVERTDLALEKLQSYILPGDLLLVKGSRGVGLDFLIRALSHR